VRKLLFLPILLAFGAQAQEVRPVDGFAVLDGGSRAVWRGEVDSGAEAAIGRWLDAHPGVPLVLELSGPGGNAVAASETAERVHRHGNVETRVPSGSACASACSTIWSGGARAVLSVGASLILHGTSCAAEDGCPPEILRLAFDLDADARARLDDADPEISALAAQSDAFRRFGGDAEAITRTKYGLRVLDIRNGRISGGER